MPYFGSYFGPSSGGGSGTYPDEDDVRDGVLYGPTGIEYEGNLGSGGEGDDHSPADVLAWVLVLLNLGSDPTTGLAWPVGVSSEPATPDNCITLTDTQGRPDGRSMIDGEKWQHEGVQIRVRGITHIVAYRRAKMIADELDRELYDRTIMVGTAQYLIHCVNRTSTLLNLGKDAPNSKRSLFSINVLMSLRKLT